MLVVVLAAEGVDLNDPAVLDHITAKAHEAAVALMGSPFHAGCLPGLCPHSAVERLNPAYPFGLLY
jgi:hypothetical protein